MSTPVNTIYINEALRRATMEAESDVKAVEEELAGLDRKDAELAQEYVATLADPTKRAGVLAKMTELAEKRRMTVEGLEAGRLMLKEARQAEEAEAERMRQEMEAAAKLTLPLDPKLIGSKGEATPRKRKTKGAPKSVQVIDVDGPMVSVSEITGFPWTRLINFVRRVLRKSVRRK